MIVWQIGNDRLCFTELMWARRGDHGRRSDPAGLMAPSYPGQVSPPPYAAQLPAAGGALSITDGRARTAPMCAGAGPVRQNRSRRPAAGGERRPSLRGNRRAPARLARRTIGRIGREVAL
ncbi:MAG TPA: hypothetical protein VMD59_07640 [Acidimicrobiales bacterium]|nr:hypothetical protein [Acidimicrobiales bacterium]